MEYEEINPAERPHLEDVFHRGDPEEVPVAPRRCCIPRLRLALDTKLVSALRSVAPRTATFDSGRLLTLKADEDPAVRGSVEDALDDIARFVPRQ